MFYVNTFIVHFGQVSARQSVFVITSIYFVSAYSAAGGEKTNNIIKRQRCLERH